jgi:hypothetical protein
MEWIDLTKTIKEATATFCQNRIGDRPPICVAEDLQADLIVMAPRRLRGMKRFPNLEYHGSGYADRSMCGLSVIDPLPSRPRHGKLTTTLFGWPRTAVANL